VVLPLLLLAAACGGQESALEPLPQEAVILAFGDSLTHGTGAKPRQSYPAVLERLTGRRVINAGRPGELSAEGVTRLGRLLERERVDLLVLCHGGNDILRRRDLEATADNLRAMIRLARGRGIATVLVGVPDFGLFLDTAGFYEDVASEMAVPIENEILPELLDDYRYKSDHVHLNAEGYRRLAEAVHVLLRERGAL